jgi:hypothetical protein
MRYWWLLSYKLLTGDIGSQTSLHLWSAHVDSIWLVSHHTVLYSSPIAIVGRTCTGFWTHIKRISRRDTGTFRELDLKRRSFAMLDWGAWNPCLLHLSAAGTELTHLTFCGLALVTTNCSQQCRRQLQISKDNGLNLRRGWSGHLQRAVFRCSSISHRQISGQTSKVGVLQQTDEGLTVYLVYLFKIV